MSMRHGWLLALVLVLGCLRQGEKKTASKGANAVDAEAQAELRDANRRDDDPMKHVPAGEPIAKLPAKVVAPAGKLTLFADFEQFKVKGNVPVYLVNRTGKPIALDHRDGFLYMMLQYEAAPGRWEPAEVRYQYWCGIPSVFHPPLLKDEHYLENTREIPREGLKTRIRYYLYGQPVTAESNETLGFVNLEEARAAQKGVVQFDTRKATDSRREER